MSDDALIGLGSNLGNRKLILDEAVRSLSLLGKVEAVSSYRETEPVGGPSGQGPFLNAVVRLRTSLDSRSLHGALHQIEADSGRIRRVRWGERTLDLDLLLRGDEVIQERDLTLPHSRFAVRRFVLSPLVDVARNMIDPLTGQTIQQLLQNVDRRPSRVALLAEDGPFLAAVTELVANRLQATLLNFSCEPVLALDPNPRPSQTSDRSNPREGFVLDDSGASQEWLMSSLRLDGELSEGVLTASRLGSVATEAAPVTFAVTLNLNWKRQAGASLAVCAVPLLKLQNLDPDEAATEVLAACAATRIG